MALPAVDNFNRANGGLGANWTTQTSQTAPQIVGNVVEASALLATDSVAHWSADAFGNDHFAEIKVTTVNGTGGNAVGVVVRAAAAAQTYYKVTLKGPSTGGLLELSKRVAGASTSLGSDTIAWTPGDLLRLTVVGTTLTVTLNGVPKLQTVDSSIAAGSAGIYIFAGGGVLADAQLDNFNANNVASAIHTVSGSGSFTIAGPSYLTLTITGRPSILTSGAANPPNWYHVGMISWGTANGALTAHPVTRDLELVALPPLMTTLWYEFTAGVTAVITELAGA